MIVCKDFNKNIISHAKDYFVLSSVKKFFQILVLVIFNTLLFLRAVLNQLREERSVKPLYYTFDF